MSEACGPFPILGTMTFGAEAQVQAAEAACIVKAFVQDASTESPHGVMIDTARIYQQATPDGDTETILGQIFAKETGVRAKVHLASKANPAMLPHKSLSKQSIIEQCDISLSKLGLSVIPIYYLHSPDVNTDIEESLSGINELHKHGKIREFGLSNYPAWAVVDIWHRCKNRGMVLPTVYQGMYNVITRDMEREIVPVVREFGLRLYMYNPLAGGLLSGRYAKMEDVAVATEGRFSTQFDRAFGKAFPAGKAYQARYVKSPIFAGLSLLREACHEAGIGMAEASLRWLVHHSYLSKADGIILGVSTICHLEPNLKAWSAGPLPQKLTDACNAAWEAARPGCESYFRGYGEKPGGIDKFLALKSAGMKKEVEEPIAKKQKL